MTQRGDGYAVFAPIAVKIQLALGEHFSFLVSIGLADATYTWRKGPFLNSCCSILAPQPKAPLWQFPPPDYKRACDTKTGPLWSFTKHFIALKRLEKLRIESELYEPVA